SSIDFSMIPKGARMLDAGCGTGDLLLKFLQYPANNRDIVCHATDISEQMLEKSAQTMEKVLPGLGSSLAFSLMSVDNMTFADDYFSLVIACEILQLTDPYQVLSDLVRITKKGGQIVISVPNALSPAIRKANTRHQGKFQGLDFEKAHDLMKPKVECFFAKPLVFAQDQAICPYEKKTLSAHLEKEDIEQANRFIIYLIK
ncbi:MAG: methyltransferase domain-containing protein, partial [Desulfobacteraceae bacterium]|nr:methyltransferase domain-containing protein [Desulfobacteraceae bacterium]